MATHNNYITIAKSIGIVLMVIGHSGCPFYLSKFIYLFHMPLFFFCSGVFFKAITTNADALSFLKKRIVKLYIPFVKWSLLFLLLHNIFMCIGIYNPYYGYWGGSSYYTLTEILLKFFLIILSMHGYEELLGGFWFIRALFISSIMIAILSIQLGTKYKYETIFFFFLILVIIVRRFAPDLELWKDVSMGALGTVFYMSGYLFKQYKNVWRNKCFMFVNFLFLILSWFYFEDGVSMGCGYNKVLLFSVSAISGSLLTLIFSLYIEKKLTFVRNVLYFIGNHTLVILALHFLSFRLVSFAGCILLGLDYAHVAEHPVVNCYPIANSLWWILYAIVGVVSPLLINMVWNYIVNTVKDIFICR